MGLHSEGLNIISEGYLRLRFFFFFGGGGGGEGGGLLLGGLVFEEGVELIIFYGILLRGLVLGLANHINAYI